MPGSPGSGSIQGASQGGHTPAFFVDEPGLLVSDLQPELVCDPLYERTELGWETRAYHSAKKLTKLPPEKSKVRQSVASQQCGSAVNNGTNAAATMAILSGLSGSCWRSGSF